MNFIAGNRMLLTKRTACDLAGRGRAQAGAPSLKVDIRPGAWPHGSSMPGPGGASLPSRVLAGLRALQCEAELAGAFEDLFWRARQPLGDVAGRRVGAGEPAEFFFRLGGPWMGRAADAVYRAARLCRRLRGREGPGVDRERRAMSSTRSCSVLPRRGRSRHA